MSSQLILGPVSFCNFTNFTMKLLWQKLLKLIKDILLGLGKNWTEISSTGWCWWIWTWIVQYKPSKKVQTHLQNREKKSCNNFSFVAFEYVRTAEIVFFMLYIIWENVFSPTLQNSDVWAFGQAENFSAPTNQNPYFYVFIIIILSYLKINLWYLRHLQKENVKVTWAIFVPICMYTLYSHFKLSLVPYSIQMHE